MFEKNKRVIEVDGKRIELDPKPTTLSGMFGKQSRPVTNDPDPPRAEQRRMPGAAGASPEQKQGYAAKAEIRQIKKPGAIYLYLERIEAKQKGLDQSLREQGVRQSVHEFLQRMMMAAAMLAAVLLISTTFLLYNVGLPIVEDLILGIIVGAASYYVSFGVFINYPAQRAKAASKNIERDILSAARDMIISLRSGMPLYNSIASVSTGYAEASKEFAKVVERVQLGLPLEDAIDQTATETKSPAFKHMMLQASTSIKAGANVVDALQSVIDQLSQERIIELRSYGQKLNAIAMFYMLFGIIVPSMGIAVITILTTFIAVFTVTDSVLGFVLVGMIVLQFIFMNMITSARPVYSM